MDRNTLPENPMISIDVALRKESVDRNPPIWTLTMHKILSLSARRAWIEIIKKGRARRPGQVALRKESVDRNSRRAISAQSGAKSLSARRAWIEIQEPSRAAFPPRVALRKESVDRNFYALVVGRGCFSRSPQGERG